MDLAFFNVHNGFSEGMARGLRTGFLTQEDYRRIGAAETLEDVRTALDDTDYGSFLQDEPSPLLVDVILQKAKQKMAHEFRYMKAQSDQPLVRFMEFIEIERMIDNVVTLLQGTMNGKSATELLAKADPLGFFEDMKTIPNMDVSQGYEDIYRTILIETPVGPYFEKFLETVNAKNASADGGNAADAGAGGVGRPIAAGSAAGSDVDGLLKDTDLELMKSTMKKAWLEDFHNFCTVGEDGMGSPCGAGTQELMGHLLKVEADFRTLMITLNALGTSIGNNAANLASRNQLYPNFGYLYPEGTDKICKAWNQTTVRQAIEPYNQYREMYDAVKIFYDKEAKKQMENQGGRRRNIKSLEDMMFVEMSKLYELTFDQQFHFGVFYAWTKLKEQEIRNIGWICNMIVMGKKEFVDDIVPIFAPKN